MYSEKWDRHWLGMALKHAEGSKDPDKQVGCVIVSPLDQVPLSWGFNGFPRKIKDTKERLHDKELKRRLMVHGERNALLNAARKGIQLDGSTLYIAAVDESGPHGGCPCTACTIELLQVGITRVVSYPAKRKSSWAADIEFARTLLVEAEIAYHEITLGCGAYGCERRDAHSHEKVA